METLYLISPDTKQLLYLVSVGSVDGYNDPRQPYSGISYERANELINLAAKEELDYDEITDEYYHAGRLWEVLLRIVRFIRQYVDVRYFGDIHIADCYGTIFISP